MGKNDYFVRPDGSLRHGDLGLEVLERQREMLAAQIQTVIDEVRPMLKGTGFIVISPKNPRFDGQEHEKVEDAQESANELAYQDGKAIIYAPMAIVKPRRETAITQPSELLKQAGFTALPAGQKVGDVPPEPK